MSKGRSSRARLTPVTPGLIKMIGFHGLLHDALVTRSTACSVLNSNPQTPP